MIEVQGIDELHRRLALMGSLLPIKQGIRKGAQYVRTQMQTYPPEHHGPLPGGFVSDRQRRFFFAALRDGSIVVPYPRTGRGGRSWRVRMEGDGLTANVESTGAPHMVYVQGYQQQARYHKITGWQTDKDVSIESAGIVLGYVKMEAEAALGGYGRYG